MNIDDTLNSIKDASMKEVKAEFRALFKQAMNDELDYIRQAAQQLDQALSYRRQGLINEDDVTTLLKKQKIIAQITANNAQIAVKIRIQKLIYRMLDIAIDILLKAIIPA